jgi:hypothetical protein
MTESWDAHTHQSALDALLNDAQAQFRPAPERPQPQQRGTQGVAHMKEKKEREQKERRRQELTAEKAEKEKRRQDALRQLEIWSESDNLLKRPSEFVCKMKFFNTLPDPPAESKVKKQKNNETKNKLLLSQQASNPPQDLEVTEHPLPESNSRLDSSLTQGQKVARYSVASGAPLSVRSHLSGT